jgi:hypothetical protein
VIRSPWRVVAVLAFLSLFAVVTAHAQTIPSSFPAVGARLSPAELALVVQRQLRAEASAARFRDAAPPAAAKRKDRIWNGLLIGAGVGAGAGALSAYAETDDCQPEEMLVCASAAGYSIILGTAVGAGVGVLIDQFVW